MLQLIPQPSEWQHAIVIDSKRIGIVTRRETGSDHYHHYAEVTIDVCGFSWMPDLARASSSDGPQAAIAAALAERILWHEAAIAAIKGIAERLAEPSA